MLLPVEGEADRRQGGAFVRRREEHLLPAHHRDIAARRLGRHRDVRGSLGQQPEDVGGHGARASAVRRPVGQGDRGPPHPPLRGIGPDPDLPLPVDADHPGHVVGLQEHRLDRCTAGCSGALLVDQIELDHVSLGPRHVLRRGVADPAARHRDDATRAVLDPVGPEHVLGQPVLRLDPDEDGDPVGPEDLALARSVLADDRLGLTTVLGEEQLRVLPALDGAQPPGPLRPVRLVLLVRPVVEELSVDRAVGPPHRRGDRRRLAAEREGLHTEPEGAGERQRAHPGRRPTAAAADPATACHDLVVPHVQGRGVGGGTVHQTHHVRRLVEVLALRHERCSLPAAGPAGCGDRSWRTS